MTEQELVLLLLIGGAVLIVGLLSVRALWQARRQRQSPIVHRPASPQRPSAPPVILGDSRPMRMSDLAGWQPIRRGLPVMIPRREDPLWNEKGWRRSAHGFEGYYRAGGRQWRGLIVSPYPGSFEAFIWHPPLAELERRTSHRYCFQGSGVGGCFKVHFSTMPISLDHAIAAVETVLSQAMGR